LKKILFAMALAALVPAAALAQSPVVTGIGPRVGVSIDPDQIVFGGQVYVGEIAPDLTLEPNLEIGIGDDLTVVAANFDLLYHFSIQGSAWRPYAGGGVGVNFISWDAPAPLRDDSETEVGLNLILGAGAPTRSGNRFFTELRFGVGDIPELKLMVGWNFKL
jgi:opacity protein-like surface antigen